MASVNPLRVSRIRVCSKGGGRYVHDTRLPGEAWMVLVRSVHAHGNIRAIDISRAAQASGVLGIFTGEHLRRDGLGGHRE